MLVRLSEGGNPSIRLQRQDGTHDDPDDGNDLN